MKICSVLTEAVIFECDLIIPSSAIMNI